MDLPALYLPDAAVDAALDSELRTLLTLCFTAPHDLRFATRRYARELPAHRWLARDRGRLVGHVAMHDKEVGTPEGPRRIAGVAEVCVHPAFRGRGIARALLASAEAGMRQFGCPFAFLFGREAVYASSGYRAVPGAIRYRVGPEGPWKVESMPSALVKPLGSEAWPAGEVDLRGPVF